jgi:glycosyltransferase involved in cell wall biosynthesis
MVGISVVIIVKNGGTLFPQCLDSLRSFEDVVVYDNGSTDDTVMIASSYPNVNLVHGEFCGFGPTKNIAASYAKHDWIFSIDSDEMMDEQLVSEIFRIALEPKNVYGLYRRNFYKSTEIKYSWGKDKVVRLYNRHMTRYDDKQVHEEIIVNGEMKLIYLRQKLLHFSYQSISEFIQKADRYSTLFARDNMGKRSSSPSKAFFNGLYTFFRTYILKRGFLDGYAGLIIAFSNMATNFYKYSKLYEMNMEYKKNNS